MASATLPSLVLLPVVMPAFRVHNFARKKGGGSVLEKEKRGREAGYQKKKKQKIKVTKHCLKLSNPAKRREPTKLKKAQTPAKVCGKQDVWPPLPFSPPSCSAPSVFIGCLLLRLIILPGYRYYADYAHIMPRKLN